MSDFAIRKNEPSTFHLVDGNGKILCKKMRPGDLSEVSKAGTFGRDICEGCKKAKQVRDILNDVEV